MQDIACSSLRTLLLTPQPNPFTISVNCYIVTVEVLTLLTYSALYLFTFLPRFSFVTEVRSVSVTIKESRRGYLVAVRPH